jgi:hypothetical protein
MAVKGPAFNEILELKLDDRLAFKKQFDLPKSAPAFCFFPFEFLLFLLRDFFRVWWRRFEPVIQLILIT